MASAARRATGPPAGGDRHLGRRCPGGSSIALLAIRTVYGTMHLAGWAALCALLLAWAGLARAEHPVEGWQGKEPGSWLLRADALGQLLPGPNGETAATATTRRPAPPLPQAAHCAQALPPQPKPACLRTPCPQAPTRLPLQARAPAAATPPGGCCARTTAPAAAACACRPTPPTAPACWPSSRFRPPCCWAASRPRASGRARRRAPRRAPRRPSVCRHAALGLGVGVGGASGGGVRACGCRSPLLPRTYQTLCLPLCTAAASAVQLLPPGCRRPCPRLPDGHRAEHRGPHRLLPAAPHPELLRAAPAGGGARGADARRRAARAPAQRRAAARRRLRGPARLELIWGWKREPLAAMGCPACCGAAHLHSQPAPLRRCSAAPPLPLATT